MQYQKIFALDVSDGIYLTNSVFVAVAGVIPLFLITKGLGWLNTYRASILPLPTAFGVFIMRQAILDVPEDLVDAAKIDGCGDLRIFLKVILPLIRSSVLALRSSLSLAHGIISSGRWWPLRKQR